MLLSNEKVAPMVRQLSWSHCLLLLPIKNINEINYYINQVCERHLSKRQLQELIKTKEYIRLDENTKNKLIKHEVTIVSDFIKNPIIIKNSNNYKIISEKILQRLILEDIEGFMKELGIHFVLLVVNKK